MSTYNLLYVGPVPPADFDDLEVIAADQTDQQLAVAKAQAEQEQGVECFVIVDDGHAKHSWSAPADPAPASPLILSKTAFQDYAVSQLGNGVTGMGRFTDIMDATRDSTNSAVRFAFARYEAAQTFEKTNTGALTSLMESAGVMTSGERTLILDNWP